MEKENGPEQVANESFDDEPKTANKQRNPNFLLRQLFSKYDEYYDEGGLYRRLGLKRTREAKDKEDAKKAPKKREIKQEAKQPPKPAAKRGRKPKKSAYAQFVEVESKGQ